VKCLFFYIFKEISSKKKKQIKRKIN